MDQFARARLGPIPLPYILIIVLLPLWIFCSIGENSLLYSLSVIITVILKGSLLSCLARYKFAPFSQWSIPVLIVNIVEVYIINTDLQIPIYLLVVLVPLSNGAGMGVFQISLDTQSQVIGIFSRSAEDEYRWLVAALSPAGVVVPFYISNSNVREFRAQVSTCTLAILYHSKTRGRINITDVTDSLYDDEVKFMSKALGREKVLVVVDGLDDSSDAAKNSILQSQQTIHNLTQDLYLFNKAENRNEEQIRRKLQPLLYTLSQGSSSLEIAADLIGPFILCVPWVHYCFSVYHGAILTLSNIGGSLLLSNYLLPFSLGSPQSGIPPLLLVTVLELLAAYWYYSGGKLVLLAAQSASTMLYAVLLSYRVAP